MKHKRILSFLVIIALICQIIMMSSCKNANSVKTSWNDVYVVPFGGYIIGNGETSTLLQIPIFIKNCDSDFDLGDIRGITLEGELTSITCNGFRLVGLNRDQGKENKIATLVFRAMFPRDGEHIVSKIKIIFNDSSIVEKEIGEILFLAIDQTQINKEAPIVMRKFMLSQSEADSLKIAYTNTSDEDVKIDSMVFPRNSFIVEKIEKYADFDLKQKESGLIIRPKETQTFLFTLSKNNEMQSDFLFLLPQTGYVFKENNDFIASQTQATAIQKPFNIEYIESLFD